MGFEIEVEFNGVTERLFWTEKLQSTSKQMLDELKERMSQHIPLVVVEPEGIDFDNDLQDVRNVYQAILNLYPNCKVIKALPEEDRIY